MQSIYRQCMPSMKVMQSIEAVHAVYRRQSMQSIEGSACSL